MDPLGTLFAVLAALMVAMMGVMVRLSTENGRPNDALVVVLICNLVLIVPTALIYHYPTYSLTPRSIGAFVLAGLVGTMLGRVFYYTSISRIGASRSDAIKASQPLHATLIAIVLIGETLTLIHFVGILFIMVGVAAVSWETTSTQAISLSRRELLIGLLFPLGAAFFYGIEPTFAKIGFSEGTPVLVGLSIKTIAASVGFLTYLRWKGALPTRFDVRGNSFQWYVGAGIANTAFLGFYYGALEIARVNVVIPIVQTSPFFVVGLSYFFLSNLEQVTFKLTAAASTIVSGAILIVTFG